MSGNPTADPKLPFPMSLDNCHDVRYLLICYHCRELLDTRHSIMRIDHGNRRYWHGRCFLSKFGARKFFALPDVDLNTLTLGDIGVEVMKKLVRRGSKR